MPEFSTLLQQGNAWLFIPSAILLGALHGLEPGHSKTMMAAFIVAIRGTVGQAVLLGLSATVSHTAVVWIVAMAGLYFGRNWDANATEPYFQLASAVLIVAIACWMLWRTWRDNARARAHNAGHDHDHDHDHDHAHPHPHPHAHAHGNDHVHAHAGHEAHESLSRVAHTYAHAQPVQRHAALGSARAEYQDAHERAHARDIEKRFADRNVTTGQIVMFGVTGGLVPCPASITVLLLCLQLKRFVLGAGLVLCFSIGLALTMVVSGVLAALSVRHVSRRWTGFGEFARKAPYFSGALIILVGLYVGYQGASHLWFTT